MSRNFTQAATEITGPILKDHLPLALPAADDGHQTVGIERQGHRRVATKRGVSARDIGPTLDTRTPSVYGLAFAACKLACRRHGADVILDGASVVTLDLIRDTARDRAEKLDAHHTARVQRWEADTAAPTRAGSVLAWIDAQEADTLRVVSVPRRLATMTRAYGHAANYRRAVEAAVQRDRIETGKQEARDTWTAAVQTPEEAALWPAMRPGLEAAHEAARDMLSALGLSRLGRAYPLAYAAARASQGAALDDICADGLPRTGRPADVLAWIDRAPAVRENVKKNLQRARALYPSAAACTIEAHAYALGVDGGRAMKSTYSRNRSADLDTPTLRDWIAEEDHAEVIARTDLELARAMRPHAPADWAHGLSPATAARYRKAAALRVKRAQGDAGATAAMPITAAPYKRGGTVR